MPGERNLTIQLHEMLAYLGQLGVATITDRGPSRASSGPMITPIDASYLADAVSAAAVLRGGRRGPRRRSRWSRSAAARTSATIREFTSGRRRHPRRRSRYAQFRGILTGVPRLRRPFRDARDGADVTDVLRDRLERRVLDPGADREGCGRSPAAVLREAGIDSCVCSTGEIARRGAQPRRRRRCSSRKKLSRGVLRDAQGHAGAAAPWSDLPLIILTRPGVDSEEALETTSRLGNVTLLERPVRITALVSAVRAGPARPGAPVSDPRVTCAIARSPPRH